MSRVTTSQKFPVTVERTRMLRLRYDDFTEVCKVDRNLSAELHRRLATHLARARQRPSGKKPSRDPVEVPSVPPAEPDEKV
jgi:CRP-like cAMP-binding protein